MGERKSGSLALKFMVGFAVGAMLGFGLCGYNFGAAMGENPHAVAMTTLGGNCFAVCALGVIGSFVWWIVSRNKDGKSS